METVEDLYQGVRTQFPATTERADRIHVRLWDEVSSETSYVWFESLAKLINEDMAAGVPYDSHKELIQLLSSAAMNGKAQLTDCVDVSFVENLFWDVPKDKRKGYWSPLPTALKELYVRFHKRDPL